jgi:hypothetical protein
MSVTFMCLYLREERRAPDQRTPLGGFGTFLLYVYPIAFVISAYSGIAVIFDTGNSQNLLPMFSNGLVVATLLLGAGKESPVMTGIEVLFGI